MTNKKKNPMPGNLPKQNRTLTDAEICEQIVAFAKVEEIKDPLEAAQFALKEFLKYADDEDKKRMIKNLEDVISGKMSHNHKISTEDHKVLLAQAEEANDA